MDHISYTTISISIHKRTSSQGSHTHTQRDTHTHNEVIREKDDADSKIVQIKEVNSAGLICQIPRDLGISGTWVSSTPNPGFGAWFSVVFRPN